MLEPRKNEGRCRLIQRNNNSNFCINFVICVEVIQNELSNEYYLPYICPCVVHGFYPMIEDGGNCISESIEIYNGDLHNCSSLLDA